ncbi:MAG: SGNH/GDSL hydrolase family protein [Hyphomicrobiales bacterium]|nr:SGNH/GDSL hydrolase family protein [Hyphomicrobiales bacterium]
MTDRPDASPPAAAHRLWRDIVIQLGLVMAVLVVFELLLRAIDLRFLRAGHREGSNITLHHDAELGWSPIPHSSGTFVGSRRFSITHNSIGLRDIEPPPPLGSKTVLFLGDSFVWGYDVEAHERFTDVLRRALPAQAIVNAGVPGYGTDQQYLLLRRLWDRIRPDAVVLVYCVDNDRQDNTSNARYDGYYKPYLAQDAEGAWRFYGQPVPKSRHVYFASDPLARHSWVARTAVSAYVELRHPRISVPDPTERLVGMIRDFVTARGARFMVGMQRREPVLEAFLAKESISQIAFDGAAHYPVDGFHWTPAGHALVAERLQAQLQRIGILP